MTARTLQLAKELAAAGVPVFPCRADNRPACLHGFKDVNVDVEELGARFSKDTAISTLKAAGVRWLWRHYPGPLIGVPTGPASGWDVLDVDRRHGGGEWWATNRHRIPARRMHRPRSNGLQVLFLHAEPVRNTAGKLAARVDTSGEGGYIVWWPAPGCRAIEARATAWPDWLVGALLERPKPPERPAGAFLALDGVDAAQRTAARVLQRLEAAQPEQFHVSAVRNAAWTIGGLLHRLPFGGAEAQRRIVAAIAAAGATGIAAHEKTARWGLKRGGSSAPLDVGAANAR